MRHLPEVARSIWDDNEYTKGVVIPVSFTIGTANNLDAGKLIENVVDSVITTQRMGKSVLITAQLTCNTKSYDLNPPSGATVFVAEDRRVLACPDVLYES